MAWQAGPARADLSQRTETAPRRSATPRVDVHAPLAALDPPRKHDQWDYSERRAAADMDHPPQGLHAYYHHKSADWPGNTPFELTGWTAGGLAKLPDYYVMPLHATMPEAVAPFMPAAEAPWLTDAELAVYAAEYARTGFAGGLQSYRRNTDSANAAELVLFSACWTGCGSRPADFRSVHLLPRAGHWVQQEQPIPVAALVSGFAAET